MTVKPTQESEVSTSLAKALVETSRRLGLSDIDTPLKDAGINQEDLNQPEARIPFVKHEKLWALLFEQTGDPDFGLKLGLGIRPASFSILGYIAINSARIGKAMDAFEKYQSLAGEGGTFRVSRIDGTSVTTYTPLNPQKSITAQRVYGMLASLVSLGQWLVGDRFTPTQASFTATQPENFELYEKQFGCPIAFNAPTNHLCFDQAVEELEIPHANHAILSLMLERANIEMADESKDTTKDRLSKAIRETLIGQEPDKEQLAKSMGISSRTLQRKLQKEESSYQEVLNQVRYQLAREYLLQTELTISDVAYLLGFTDPSPFHRLFKQWEGKTPGQYRDEQSKT
jgi:AraC-like DNA-binding protein